MEISYDEMKNIVGILWGPDPEEIKGAIYVLETMAAGFYEDDLAANLAGVAKQIRELTNRKGNA